MAEVLDLLHREFVYVWYYFTVQLEQIFGWWVLGMVLGSAISVFARDRLHGLFRALSGRRLGALGVIPASLLGIASPLCMYGTIPIAASFARQGMRHDWLAAFMMSSILLNPQLILYSGALGPTALWVRIISCCICGAAAGWQPTSFRYHFVMWQYTSSGYVDGISTRVDLNLCLADWDFAREDGGGAEELLRAE